VRSELSARRAGANPSSSSSSLEALDGGSSLSSPIETSLKACSTSLLASSSCPTAGSARRRTRAPSSSAPPKQLLRRLLDMKRPFALNRDSYRRLLRTSSCFRLLDAPAALAGTERKGGSSQRRSARAQLYITFQQPYSCFNFNPVPLDSSTPTSTPNHVFRSRVFLVSLSHQPPAQSMLLTRAPVQRFTSTITRQLRLASSHHKFLIVGAGTAGTTVAAQLRRAFDAEGRALGEGEVALVDKAERHHCELLLLLERKW
jgi:hypothetical protein